MQFDELQIFALIEGSIRNLSNTFGCCEAFQRRAFEESAFADECDAVVQINGSQVLAIFETPIRDLGHRGRYMD